MKRRAGRYGDVVYEFNMTMDELIDVCNGYIDQHRYRIRGNEMSEAMEFLKCLTILYRNPCNSYAERVFECEIAPACEITKRRYGGYPCLNVDVHRESVTLIDYGNRVELLFCTDGEIKDPGLGRIMLAADELEEDLQRQHRRPTKRNHLANEPRTTSGTINIRGEYSYKFDMSVDDLIKLCDEQIKLLMDGRYRADGQATLKAMEHLKCVPVLFNDTDNKCALGQLNGRTINRCEVTKQRYDDTSHTCVIVETRFDSVTLVDYGDSIELLFYIDTQSPDQCIPRIWRATAVLNEKYQACQPVKPDSRPTETKPKAKVKPTTKPTTKGETQMAIIPTQPTKPITLSKPSKASDYDLPLRDDLQWLAQNVSKINHHFELASFGQTLHLGKSTDDTPPSFSAKLVVRPTTIVTESTYEVTLIWRDVEYVDGIFRTSRYPEFHSKEVTDFYQVAQQVKHSCSPTISELFYSAAIHLDYQRGGYIVNQDDASDGKKS